MTDKPSKKFTGPKGPFIVWSPEGEAPAKVEHATHGKALWAAWKLAEEHPGQTFYVMGRAGKPAFVSAQKDAA